MSNFEYYWPTEPGRHVLHVRERYIEIMFLENGLWNNGFNPDITHTTEQLQRMGYLGAQRERLVTHVPPSDAAELHALILRCDAMDLRFIEGRCHVTVTVGDITATSVGVSKQDAIRAAVSRVDDVHRELAKRGRCSCGGEFDTKYKCTVCGWDCVGDVV